MRNLKFACLVSAFALASTPAFAQDAQEAETGAVADGDIVVTANRTSSLLSKTPIAMSAVGGEDLIAAGITNPTQLEETIPNLSIVRGNGLQITIRGVTSTDGTEKGDPSAAFMVNGIYLARPQAQEVSFFDIERIEVLRGPQGTLYGRNSTAGVVNILTAQPKFEFGARADVVYGNFNALNGTVVLNVPASDTLAFRVAANIDQRDNYIIDGAPNDNATLDKFKNNKSVRLSALWKPTPDLSLLVMGDYSSVKGNPTNGVSPANFYSNIASGVRPTFNAPIYRSLDPDVARVLSIPQAQQGFRDNEEKGVMAELNYTMGNVTLTYLGSYRESERREFANSANGLFSNDFIGSYWQTSQEVRLAYGGDGPLQAQIGGYYFKEKSGIAFFLNNLLGANTRFGFPQDPTIAENKSAFGQVTYEVAENLRVTGGIRYSHDLKSRIGQTVVDFYDRIGNSYSVGNFIRRQVNQVNNAERTFSELTWRAGVDYDSPLGLVFASVSTGYKAGGFNDGCEIGTATNCNLPAGALYYDPETLTAYEAGFKFRFSPAFRLNGTVFHYDYQGLQLSQLSDICGGPCQVTTNAAKAKIDGVELDATLQPVDRFAIRLALNWLDARYDQFLPNPAINFAGRPLNRSPKWSWIAGMNYTLPIGEGRMVFDAQTSSRSRFEVTDLANFAYFYQPAATKTDMSVTYNAPDDRFYIAGFVENLENNLVVTGATTGLFGSVTFADPRTYGVRAGFKF
ncbi:MAG: TonB-dependent receptor [Novosphingobium sp.]|uniref:TonB-dependent receptor n=1 Tax=Novosphingobium sp. TaxID=1874826 RepID=UPI000BD56BE3|nr:TonB-dependent receptor [Novosphingobium sp.]MDP3549066.1 TonB-dependent receptor [Novosphingobium sp.]OYZ97752.1 MAG: TonB-dependent receptor, plug [Novosphingobium sp. 17-62-8]